MILNLDKQDLISLINGRSPSYAQMEIPVIAKNGRYIGGHSDKWIWEDLRFLTEDELLEIYRLLKPEVAAPVKGDIAGNRREAEYVHGLLNTIDEEPAPIDKKIDTAVRFLREKFIVANVLILNSEDYNDFQLWCKKMSFMASVGCTVENFTYAGMTMKIYRSSWFISVIGKLNNTDMLLDNTDNRLFNLDTLGEL